MFARVLPMARISARSGHVWQVRVQKPPKKGYFVDCYPNFSKSRTKAAVFKSYVTL